MAVVSPVLLALPMTMRPIAGVVMVNVVHGTGSAKNSVTMRSSSTVTADRRVPVFSSEYHLTERGEKGRLVMVLLFSGSPLLPGGVGDFSVRDDGNASYRSIGVISP